MGKTSLPPGFRFHPTDLELSVYYLKRKIMGKPFRFEAISEIELYKFAPWDLPDKSCLQSNDREWYFFCPTDRKYSNSSRKNRATDNGYWKTTGKDRPISYNSRIVARKKTLIFHVGKVPQGERTDWVMHEYRLEDKELVDAGFFLDAYVLCRIFEKSGRGPKIGEQYGALFREEDWEDEVNDSSVLVPPTCDGSMNVQHQFSDQVLQSDSIAMDGIPPGSPEYVNVNRLLQELSGNNNNELFVAQDGEMADPLILHGGSTYGNETHNSLETHSSQVELEPADDIYFSNDIEHALEHDLLDLSGQALPRSITDIYSLSNSGNENILQLTLLGVGDRSYMEMWDFQFPVEAHFPEFAVPENLFGYCPSFQNLSSVTHVNDIHDSSSGTIYP